MYSQKSYSTYMKEGIVIKLRIKMGNKIKRNEMKEAVLDNTESGKKLQTLVLDKYRPPSYCQEIQSAVFTESHKW